MTAPLDLPGADIQPHNEARWRTLIHDHGLGAVQRAIAGIVRRPAPLADVQRRITQPLIAGPGVLRAAAPLSVMVSIAKSNTRCGPPTAPYGLPASLGPRPTASPAPAPKEPTTMPETNTTPRPHPLLAELDRVRESRGISRQELIRQAKISSASLHALKQGTCGPRLEARLRAWISGDPGTEPVPNDAPPARPATTRKRAVVKAVPTDRTFTTGPAIDVAALVRALGLRVIELPNLAVDEAASPRLTPNPGGTLRLAVLP